MKPAAPEPRLLDIAGLELAELEARLVEMGAPRYHAKQIFTWIHRRGVTDVPGLYFIGLTWQHTRGSALIGWVKDDAEYIAARIAEYQESKARSPRETPVSTGGASADGSLA